MASLTDCLVYRLTAVWRFMAIPVWHLSCSSFNGWTLTWYLHTICGR